ncbi:MAG: 3-octaprenyl-4-hydroxybenzoate carboxy-lyase UbiD [Planctomycetota bacterium]|nr:MAG: 3-octaprenyl-4-hydroxybenzoate carboxy-lyase UbiD [Planctomycetota bacterium]
MPGVLAITAPRFDPRGGASDGEQERSIGQFLRHFDTTSPINAFPLVTLVDDSEFAARNLNNWLWTTFTRSNPAADVTGLGAFVHQKHWGCRGSLIIDARIKPHHAPPLIEDSEVTRRVDALFANNGPLHGLW